VCVCVCVCVCLCVCVCVCVCVVCLCVCVCLCVGVLVCGCVTPVGTLFPGNSIRDGGASAVARALLANSGLTFADVGSEHACGSSARASRYACAPCRQRHWRHRGDCVGGCASVPRSNGVGYVPCVAVRTRCIDGRRRLAVDCAPSVSFIVTPGPQETGLQPLGLPRSPTRCNRRRPLSQTSI
jgi:hypothetical protein